MARLTTAQREAMLDLYYGDDLDASRSTLETLVDKGFVARKIGAGGREYYRLTKIGMNVAKMMAGDFRRRRRR